MKGQAERSLLATAIAFVLAFAMVALPLAPASTAAPAAPVAPVGATASSPSIVDVPGGGRTETAASVLVVSDQPAALAPDRSSDWLRLAVIVLVALVVLVPALWIHLGGRRRQRSAT